MQIRLQEVRAPLQTINAIQTDPFVQCEILCLATVPGEPPVSRSFRRLMKGWFVSQEGGCSYNPHKLGEKARPASVGLKPYKLMS